MAEGLFHFGIPFAHHHAIIPFPEGGEGNLK